MKRLLRGFSYVGQTLGFGGTTTHSIFNCSIEQLLERDKETCSINDLNSSSKYHSDAENNTVDILIGARLGEKETPSQQHKSCSQNSVKIDSESAYLSSESTLVGSEHQLVPFALQQFVSFLSRSEGEFVHFNH
jgi:hypothetical protein